MECHNGLEPPHSFSRKTKTELWHTPPQKPPAGVNLTRIRVKGKGFLKHMVRRIVGLLVEAISSDNEINRETVFDGIIGRGWSKDECDGGRELIFVEEHCRWVLFMLFTVDSFVPCSCACVYPQSASVSKQPPLLYVQREPNLFFFFFGDASSCNMPMLRMHQTNVL